MSAEYVTDSTGVTHLMNPAGSGEFTWCDEPVVSADPGQAFGDTTGAQRGRGPATCRACRQAVDQARDSWRGARWKLA